MSARPGARRTGRYEPAGHGDRWLRERGHQLLTTHTAALGALDRYAEVPMPPRYPGSPTPESAPAPAPEPPPERPVRPGPGAAVLLAALAAGVAHAGIAGHGLLALPAGPLPAMTAQLAGYLGGAAVTAAVAGSAELLARAVTEHAAAPRPPRYLPDPVAERVEAGPGPRRWLPALAALCFGGSAVLAAGCVYLAFGGPAPWGGSAAGGGAALAALVGYIALLYARLHHHASAPPPLPPATRPRPAATAEVPDDLDPNPEVQRQRNRALAAAALDRHERMWTLALHECQTLLRLGRRADAAEPLRAALAAVATTERAPSTLDSVLARLPADARGTDAPLASVLTALHAYHPWPLRRRFEQIPGDLPPLPGTPRPTSA
ncbi:hypothetical protein [Allonocardiopsis opalescens]|uniref:Uncharacterized protein n=1 Tax=Allonocardiopsis opalescens TaxID=1144618 RepID=A0A2T0QA30_9ACTN|nr:hypothetical protein [Allonocardiopsis opalescens]PRY00714.1 hypothetical protein CLV72_102346 [Allonocardiopsis opalescens]